MVSLVSGLRLILSINNQFSNDLEPDSRIATFLNHIKLGFSISLFILIFTIVIWFLLFYLLGIAFFISWILLIESGLLFTFAGLFGTANSSPSISGLRVLLFKAQPLQKEEIVRAFNTTLVYSISALFLFFYSGFFFVG